MGLMDGPLEIGPAHGPLGLTGLAGLLRSLFGTLLENCEAFRLSTTQAEVRLGP